MNSKTLVQRVLGAGVALGMASCAGESKIDPDLERVSTTQTPAKYSDYVKVPTTVDYNQVKWDSAYFEAIDFYTYNGNLVLFKLRFESSCRDAKKTRAVRVLTFDELRDLGIDTRGELRTYLKDRATKFEGYLGPNLML